MALDHRCSSIPNNTKGQDILEECVVIQAQGTAFLKGCISAFFQAESGVMLSILLCQVSILDVLR